MGSCCSRARSPNSPYPGANAATSSAHAINANNNNNNNSNANSPPNTTSAAAAAAAGASGSQPTGTGTGTNDSTSRRSRRRLSSHHHHNQPPLDQHINKPLRRHEWTSHDRTWTPASLRRERAEFFDTRVTGRQEVWQTLRAALEVLWEADVTSRRRRGRVLTAQGQGTGTGTSGGDEVPPVEREEDPAVALATAQSILDAGDITLPTGDLHNGAYDALGNYYALPHQVVADPVNLVWKPGDDDDALDEDEEDEDAKADLTAGEETERENDLDEAERRREEKGKAVADIRDQITIRARLSDGSRDVSVVADKGDSVRRVARIVAEEAQLASNKKIRIAYMGKILQEGTPLSAQGWKQGYMVNALVFNR